MKGDNVNFVMDAKLAGRVREYVESSTDKRIVDPKTVADALVKKYRYEYARKKRKPLINAIQRVLTRIGVKTGTTESLEYRYERKRKAVSEPTSPGIAKDEEDSFSDNDNYKHYPDSNLVNSSLVSLYKNSNVSNESVLPFVVDRKPDSTAAGKPTETKQKRLKRASKPDNKLLSNDLTLDIERPTVTFNDVGGFENQLVDICKLCLHLKHPKIYCSLGVRPPRGFLLHGPPGCGKTLLAHAIAGELDLPMIRIASPELVTGVSGESENKIRQLFARVVENAPCILFLDEIDAITPKRETAQREMERRIVAQLVFCLDDLSNTDTANEETTPSHVLVIGATSRLDALDAGLRRAGRFDKEIGLGIPDENGREKILHVLCRGLRLAPEINLKQLARLSPGYVGADLSSLVSEASMCAVNRLVKLMSNSCTQEQSELTRLLEFLKTDISIPDSSLSNIFILLSDFQNALKSVHPSAKREGFATVPDVSWDDVGALAQVRDELKWSILYPIKCPEQFEAFNLGSKPQGVLLSGPPGCGKTLLAKAVANETGMNFISVKGPELLSMYVGESERAVRQVFQRARNSAPCVIFFDEIDALCPKRSDNESSGSVRVVNQLLTEMDGIEERKQVFIMGATNRPDIVDPAIMRPGRLDKVLYVGFPSNTDRVDILKALSKNGTKPRFGEEVDLNKICDDERTKWFTGADMAALLREASVVALRQILNTGMSEAFDSTSCIVSQTHFLSALDKVHPSVSAQDRLRYENLRTPSNFT